MSVCCLSVFRTATAWFFFAFLLIVYGIKRSYYYKALLCDMIVVLVRLRGWGMGLGCVSGLTLCPVSVCVLLKFLNLLAQA